MINWANCLDCNMSQEEIEKYSSKYLITVDFKEETIFTAAELGIYIGATCAFVGTSVKFHLLFSPLYQLVFSMFYQCPHQS